MSIVTQHPKLIDMIWCSRLPNLIESLKTEAGEELNIHTSFCIQIYLLFLR